MPTSSSSSTARCLAFLARPALVGADRLDDLPADGVLGVQARQRILEHHGDPRAADALHRRRRQRQQVGVVEPRRPATRAPRTSCRTACAVTDLPEPVSPTMPTVSPAATSNETPRTAWTSPSSVGNVTARSTTDSSVPDDIDLTSPGRRTNDCSASVTVVRPPNCPHDSPGHLDRFFDGGGHEQPAGYARAVRRGNSITVSGTTANDGAGGALHPGDTGAQTTAALRQALDAVEGLGGTIDDVVRTRIISFPQPTGGRRRRRTPLRSAPSTRPTPSSSSTASSGTTSSSRSRSTPSSSTARTVAEPRPRFSLRLNNDVPVAEFVELARLAESLEFDQVWVSHDLFFRSAPVLLSAAAAATTRASRSARACSIRTRCTPPRSR